MVIRAAEQLFCVQLIRPRNDGVADIERITHAWLLALLVLIAHACCGEMPNEHAMHLLDMSEERMARTCSSLSLLSGWRARPCCASPCAILSAWLSARVAPAQVRRTVVRRAAIVVGHLMQFARLPADERQRDHTVNVHPLSAASVVEHHRQVAAFLLDWRHDVPRERSESSQRRRARILTPERTRPADDTRSRDLPSPQRGAIPRSSLLLCKLDFDVSIDVCGQLRSNFLGVAPGHSPDCWHSCTRAISIATSSAAVSSCSSVNVKTATRAAASSPRQSRRTFRRPAERVPHACAIVGDLSCVSESRGR